MTDITSIPENELLPFVVDEDGEIVAVQVGEGKVASADEVAI